MITQRVRHPGLFKASWRIVPAAVTKFVKEVGTSDGLWIDLPDVVVAHLTLHLVPRQFWHEGYYYQASELLVQLCESDYTNEEILIRLRCMEACQ